MSKAMTNFHRGEETKEEVGEMVDRRREEVEEGEETDLSTLELLTVEQFRQLLPPPFPPLAGSCGGGGEEPACGLETTYVRRYRQELKLLELRLFLTTFSVTTVTIPRSVWEEGRSGECCCSTTCRHTAGRSRPGGTAALQEVQGVQEVEQLYRGSIASGALCRLQAPSRHRSLLP